MAMSVNVLEIGVDVSKADLVISRSDQKDVETIANTPGAIARWLKGLTGPARIAVEATNTYHLAILKAVHQAGYPVFVVDGYCLNKYRESLRARAKTDNSDAVLLRRYLNREWRDLRAWEPPSEGYTTLQGLLHRRAKVVQTITQLRQSFRDLPGFKADIQSTLRRLKRLEAKLTQAALRTIHHQGWTADWTRCKDIEGIGPVIAAALVMASNRGQFQSSDAFIAFLGLDVRVRDSGRSKGRRKLTKKGDPELRRLLYLAAMSAARMPAWRDFYQRCLNRGLSKIQANVVLARKLARVAFALIKNQTQYQPKIDQKACITT